MKKIVHIFVCASCLLLCGCYPDDLEKQTLEFSLQGVYDVGYSSVEARAHVASPWLEITQRGFCFVNNTDMPYGEREPSLRIDPKIVCGDGEGDFSTQITGLESGGRYKLNAYLVTGEDTLYTNSVSFTTLDNKGKLPLITTNPTVTNVTYASAILGGEVASEGAYTVIERGFCWTQYSWSADDPNVNDSHVQVGAGTGSFTAPLSDLLASTDYVARAYAVNHAGVSYGNIVYFTTVTNPMEVFTIAVGDITTSGARVTGNLRGIDLSQVSECGVCWGFTRNPAIGKDKKKVAVLQADGKWSVTLDGLQSGARYYYRTYAINPYGTVYSGGDYFQVN